MCESPAVLETLPAEHSKHDVDPAKCIVVVSESILAKSLILIHTPKALEKLLGWHCVHIMAPACRSC